ncbi:MAG: methionine--tRNA ligase [Candidatus Vogelbacteria bacterium]|nr:methionine--tRNA ligase [Candidatus Vogelbacteria bacterium]
MLEKVTIDDFKKLHICSGIILEAKKVTGADKLLCLRVDLNEKEPRQILSGIAEWHEPDQLIGKHVFVLANLLPRTIRGLTSDGMILAAGDGKPVLLVPEEVIPAGSIVR